jgi:hypothetical protein
MSEWRSLGECVRSLSDKRPGFNVRPSHLRTVTGREGAGGGAWEGKGESKGVRYETYVLRID